MDTVRRLVVSTAITRLAPRPSMSPTAGISSGAPPLSLGNGGSVGGGGGSIALPGASPPPPVPTTPSPASSAASSAPASASNPAIRSCVDGATPALPADGADVSRLLLGPSTGDGGALEVLARPAARAAAAGAVLGMAGGDGGATTNGAHGTCSAAGLRAYAAAKLPPAPLPQSPKPSPHVPSPPQPHSHCSSRTASTAACASIAKRSFAPAPRAAHAPVRGSTTGGGGAGTAPRYAPATSYDTASTMGPGSSDRRCAISRSPATSITPPVSVRTRSP